MKYWICISKNIPLREYRQIIFSGFIDSDKQTAEEIKQSILEHHKKKKLKGLKVTVTGSS